MVIFGAMPILEKLKNRARAYPQHIVLPEGEDRRAIAAVEIGRASCRERV